MGLFKGGPFDFNGDGRTDGFEMMVGFQMTAGSRREAKNRTGGDTFYMGNDSMEEELEMAGLDCFDLEMMDEEERREALEDAGLDPDDFEF